MKTTNYAERIHKARIAASVPQKELARAAGKSHTYVYLVERGKLSVTHETAEALLRIIEMLVRAKQCAEQAKRKALANWKP